MQEGRRRRQPIQEGAGSLWVSCGTVRLRCVETGRWSGGASDLRCGEAERVEDGVRPLFRWKRFVVGRCRLMLAVVRCSGGGVVGGGGRGRSSSSTESTRKERRRGLLQEKRRLAPPGPQGSRILWLASRWLSAL